VLAESQPLDRKFENRIPKIETISKYESRIPQMLGTLPKDCAKDVHKLEGFPNQTVAFAFCFTQPSNLKQAQEENALFGLLPTDFDP
jgi:hypothetical protein